MKLKTQKNLSIFVILTVLAFMTGCQQEEPIKTCNDVECSFGSNCFYGECVPDPVSQSQCEMVICDVGETCVYGDCYDNSILNVGEDSASCDCATNSNCCKADQTCFSNICVDKCSIIECNQGEYCKSGECVPGANPCRDIVCSYGEYCKDGLCFPSIVDPCSGITCMPNEICQNGQCVVKDPCQGVSCGPNEVCRNGTCVPVDPCEFMQCYIGQYCENGVCKNTDLCASVNCPEDQYCKDGNCVDKCSAVQCKPNEECKSGVCYDKCSLKQCTDQTYCTILNGKAECVAGSLEIKLRIMAANITSGNKQSYDPGEGTRIFQAFKPDIVLIQEFNYFKGSLRSYVDSTFGPEYYYCVGNGSIPNGVISRYPLIEINGEECGAWKSNQINNRDWNWAVIDLPGPKDLLAVSVHLSTDKNSQEMPPLYKKIKEKINSGNYFVVLGGDFNTKKRANVKNQFGSTFDVSEPFPADQSGNDNTNEGRNKPYDWLLASYALDKLEVPLVIGSSTFPHGLVFDSRVYEPLSDVAPVQRKDSDAANMQHMAVIRDFVYKYNGN